MDPITDLTDRLREALNAAYTYEDSDNAIPTLPFVDDIEAFWQPFAVKVAAALKDYCTLGKHNTPPPK